MKEKLGKFALRLTIFTVLLFLIQYLITSAFLENINLYYSLYSIYIFHILSTLIIYILLLWVYFNFNDKTGFAFMGASFLKMVAAVAFLLPLMLSGHPSPFVTIISFFIPYFLYLIFETLYAVKLINSK